MLSASFLSIHRSSWYGTSDICICVVVGVVDAVNGGKRDVCDVADAVIGKKDRVVGDAVCDFGDVVFSVVGSCEVDGVGVIDADEVSDGVGHGVSVGCAHSVNAHGAVGEGDSVGGERFISNTANYSLPCPHGFSVDLSSAC